MKKQILLIFLCLPVFLCAQDFQTDFKYYPASPGFEMCEWLYDPHYDENNRITHYTLGGNLFRIDYIYMMQPAGWKGKQSEKRSLLSYTHNKQIQMSVTADGETFQYIITSDEKGRLVSQKVIRSNGEIILEGRFAYDNKGNTIVDKKIIIEPDHSAKRYYRYISGINADGIAESVFFIRNTDGYKKTHTVREERNASGRPLTYISWREEGSEPKDRIKAIRTYNERYLRTFQQYYYWNAHDSVWYPGSRKWMYDYNKEGRTTRYEFADLKQGEWYVKRRETREYDSAGKLLFKESVWKDEWEVWQGGGQEYYTYDNLSRVIRFRSRRWYREKWNELQLEKIHYQPNSIQHEYYRPPLGTWVKFKTMTENPDGTTTTERHSVVSQTNRFNDSDLIRFRK